MRACRRTRRRSSAPRSNSTPRRRRRSGPSTSSTSPSCLAIGDKRFAGIKAYASSYGSLTDAKATELIDLAIGLEEQRLALIKRYLGEFRKVIPAVKVGRWYQAEMGLNRIVDVRLAAELPLAEVSAAGAAMS